MARTLQILSDPPGVDPTLSILAALGLEDAIISVGPVAGEGSEGTVVSAVPVSPDLERTDATVMPPARSLPPAETEQSATELEESTPVDADVVVSDADLHADWVTVAFDWGEASKSSPPVIQLQPDVAFVAPAAAEFHTESLSVIPGAEADSAAFDGASAAKGGKPGPGGGGGGGGGEGVLTDYFSGDLDGSAGYDIWIKFKGSEWTVDLQQPFKNAADYFTTIITEDIGGGGRIGRVIVDDLYVTAEVKPIDGTGGILGQAGPSHVWTASELTADGQMQFDAADALTFLNLGLWDDIVTHELMHVLGFGSLWNYGDDPLVIGNQYVGAAGLAAYQETHAGALFIPVETDGGSGTAGSHWDETALGNELMTGYINTEGNYLSKFSVMSLADLNYALDPLNYQPLTV